MKLDKKDLKFMASKLNLAENLWFFGGGGLKDECINVCNQFGPNRLNKIKYIIK